MCLMWPSMCRVLREENLWLPKGKTVGMAWTRGKWLFVPLEPGYVLTLGECGGRKEISIWRSLHYCG